LSVTLDEVRHIADLARLSFDDEELLALARQMNEILAHFDTLRRVDTEGVEPAFGTLRRRNVFRADVVGEMLSSEEALSNAPDRRGDHFAVPAFLPEP